MKLNKIFIFSIVLLLCFIIFKYTFDNKLDYLALGDDLSKGKTPFGNYGKSFTDFFAQYLENKNKLKSYNNKFVGENYRTTDLINDIASDKSIIFNNKKININQAIVNAELITISIGLNDVFYKLTYNNIRNNQINSIFDYIDEMFEDIYILLTNIRKLNDCKIFIIGFYNHLNITNVKEEEIVENIFQYIDEKYKNLEQIKKVYYINIKEGFDKKPYYLPNKKLSYPSLEGYNYISTRIIDRYEKKY